MKDAEELYKYLGSVEASFALLSALCLPRFASVASRIAAVLAEKAGIPNYVPSGAWSSPTHVVAQPSFSNLYEGVVKWGLVEGVSSQSGESRIAGDVELLRGRFYGGSMGVSSMGSARR